VFYFFHVAAGTFKIAFVAGVCGSRYISIGQRFPGLILTE
jgi:hypothetical protein